MATGQQSVFEQEFEKFLQDLKRNPKSKKKADFIGQIQLQNAKSTPDELQASVEQLMKTCADKRMRRWYAKSFWPVVNTLKDYTGVIDTMVQAYPMPATLIWGGLKIVLECAGRHGQQFDKIKSNLETLGDHLWVISQCEDLYGTSPYGVNAVRRVISRSYITIIKFWYRCTKVIEHPIRYIAATDHKLYGILQDLQKNSVELKDICDRAEALLNQETRKGFAKELVESAIERSAAKVDREEAEKERIEAGKERARAETERALAQKARELAEQERIEAETEREKARLHRLDDTYWKEEQSRRQTDDKLQSLMERIGARNELNFGLLEDARSDRYPGTCEWLLQHNKFCAWLAEHTNTPVLWLNGKHGAGKSFLCASAIDYISGNPDAKRTVFQFLTKDHHVSRNQLLRNLAYQLLDCLVARLNEIPDSLEPFLNVNKEDSKSMENLIRVVLLELQFTYIFIDGLDEADYTEAEGRPSSSVARPRNEIPDVVTFLIEEAISHAGKVRLWCGSQYSPTIQEYIFKIRKEAVLEMSLHTHDTEHDIKRYLFSAIPDSTRDKDAFSTLVIAATIATEVEGSFLWASSMVEDLRERAEDSDDLMQLAREGLPTTMTEQYAKIVARIKQRDRGNKDLPLWKIVLSLLAFAKRPLRISEVIEAVAMTRTERNQDLNLNKQVDLRKILNCCMSFVRFIRTKSNHEDGILRLSHSAARAFLLRNSDMADTPPQEVKQLVSSKILRDCCLQYLLQPKYSRPLQKRSSETFCTWNGEKMVSQKLAKYAAKYWYQHFDAPSPTAQNRAEVEQFLQSPNFQTCIQIQSLFVIGHFLQSFDLITDQGNFTKRTLPNWMLATEMSRQYLEFTSEWVELLRSELSTQFTGEIDRCFWKSLGYKNFLAKNKSRYDCFEIGQNVNWDTTTKTCLIQQLSPDGKDLTICWAQTDKQINKLRLEHWTIDARKAPQVKSTNILELPTDDVQLGLYALPCSRSFPLVPNPYCVEPPDAISLHQAGAALRIGSKMATDLFRDMPKLSASSFPTNSLGDVWEELRVRGPFLVVCRRRVLKDGRSTADQAKEARRIQSMKQRIRAVERSRYRKEHSQGRRPLQRLKTVEGVKNGTLLRLQANRIFDRLGSNDADNLKSSRAQNRVLKQIFEGSINLQDSEMESSTGEPDNDHVDSGSITDSSGSGSTSFAELSSAEESWSEGSTETEESSSDGTFSDASTRSSMADSYEESDRESYSSDDTPESEEESILSDMPDSADEEDGGGLSLPLPTSFKDATDYHVPGFNDTDSESGSSSDFLSKAGALTDESERKLSVPSINFLEWLDSVICDACDRRTPYRWYHCTKCSNNNFDLCRDCERRGQWCLDKSHQLYDMIADMDGRKSVGVISRTDFKIRQELNVYNTSTGIPKMVYHFRKKYESMLYESPPEIHPQLFLVVWPLSGSQLLFADFEANKYFEQKIKPASKRGRPISVQLSFSPCGNLLRVATIDATVEKPARSSRKDVTSTARVQSRLCLNLHILVLQLASRKPTKSPPKLLGTTSLRLGCCVRPLVQRLPFAFTWGLSELYLTMSGSRLSVYRVTLPGAQSTIPLENEVTSSKTTIRTVTSGGSCNPSSSCGKADRVPGPVASNPANTTAAYNDFTILVPRETIFLPRSSRNRSVQFFPPQLPEGKSTVIIGPRYGAHSSSAIGVYLSEKDLGGWVDVAEKEGEEVRLSGPLQRLEGQFEEFNAEPDCDIIPFDL